MAAIPTGTDNLDTTARVIRVAHQADMSYGYPTADAQSHLVPFGTAMFSATGAGGDYLGTVLNGSLTYTADRKTRPDGLGGTAEVTYTNIRWEGTLTCTFKLALTTSAAGAASAGKGPIPIGQIITLITPNCGETFVAPSSGTVAPLVTAWAAKHFTVDQLDFKFADGEYATYDVKLTHEHSLMAGGSPNSAEVNSEGEVVQLTEEPVNS